MAINDILSGVLVGLGLKKSEEQKLQEKIEETEASVRRLYDQLDEHIADIQKREAQLRTLRLQYEKSQNAEKEALAMKMRTIMELLKDARESRTLLARDITNYNTMVHNLKIALENLRHPVQTEAFEELTDDKREIVADMKDEDKAACDLRNATYVPGGTDAAAGERDASQTDYAALDKELDELIGKPESSEDNKSSNNHNTLENA